MVRSPFSASIFLLQYQLVCLQGFVMPADRIQMFHTWDAAVGGL